MAGHGEIPAAAGAARTNAMPVRGIRSADCYLRQGDRPLKGLLKDPITEIILIK